MVTQLANYQTQSNPDCQLLFPSTFELNPSDQSIEIVNIANAYKANKKFAPLNKSLLHIHNRRYLGNKHRLLDFIEEIVKHKCGVYESFCDIFAGTGVVGDRFNSSSVECISNDILFSNYIPLLTFLGATNIDYKLLKEKIDYLNSIDAKTDNYFSNHYGNTYFSLNNARKIGTIRQEIEFISISDEEHAALLTSLIYATDKVANTVGHYDAFRKDLDSLNPIKLLVPKVDLDNNIGNKIYREDANSLVRKMSFEILYVDPPYNSRQYCDAYHLLENLAVWEKPRVYGKAKKMDRTHLKSKYCLKSASEAFADLIANARCKHILISYNNTGESKDGRSNARINDATIQQILKEKGKLEIFEKEYKAFTAGQSTTSGHTERIFYCRVTK